MFVWNNVQVYWNLNLINMKESTGIISVYSPLDNGKYYK